MANIDQSISKRLIFAISLTAVTLVAEIIGGLWSNSMALLSDAGHVFLDLFALVLSLAAIKLAAQPPSELHSYGWHRAEVLASLINGLTVFLMAVGILYEGSKRLIAPQEVHTTTMLVIAVFGLVANLLAAKGLHGHSHDDLNVRSAFLHVLGDAAASVGVIAAAVLMHYTGWYQADPLISIAIGLLILVGAGRVLREAVHILMEGVPRGMSVEHVAATIRAIEGVAGVHHLNIWSVCSHIFALSAHVEIEPEHEGERSQLLHTIEHELEHGFHITHTTIQFDCPSSCNGGPLIKEFNHVEREARCCGHSH
ncbi:MAG: cation diffusion facilitator family transporter [Desulfuromonadaceae bacterium]|nr:cation diffusion facilitator family transporter [Desulfuromonadaceae bacterium]MDD2850087.1 cation diffusion facilitator family transporter [Desulfuromonadaceae bacterium]MDD4130366.1 cation diffusion facilitator family transporter [Desulfuromonadaceae bacterium]